MIQFYDEFQKPRLRARRVSEDSFARWVAERAKRADDWVYDVTHGGSVCNSYGYKADTECLLAVSDPFGNVLCFPGRARANKVSERGAANACLEGAGLLFDLRVKDDLTKESVRKMLQSLHEQHFPAMLVIATAATA